MLTIRRKLPQYALLMRLDKPIGILLLLWPTLWALWLANKGFPNLRLLMIFIMGTILMRSAGCVINDFFDRHIDGFIKRTKKRPLVTGGVTPKEAVLLAAILTGIAFFLVLSCNYLTIKLAFIGVLVTVLYPLLKRVTQLPQFGLGIAFAWGVPMAFAALQVHLSLCVWFLFLTGMIWPVIYDTMYAMVDRDDDKAVGVKSTAILFDEMDIFIIALLQLLFIMMLVIVGLMFHLHTSYYTALIGVLLLFIYQQWLLKDRDRQNCFKAFLNNHWVGLIIFLGIFTNYL